MSATKAAQASANRCHLSDDSTLSSVGAPSLEMTIGAAGCALSAACFGRSGAVRSEDPVVVDCRRECARRKPPAARAGASRPPVRWPTSTRTCRPRLMTLRSNSAASVMNRAWIMLK